MYGSKLSAEQMMGTELRVSGTPTITGRFFLPHPARYAAVLFYHYQILSKVQSITMTWPESIPVVSPSQSKELDGTLHYIGLGGNIFEA